MFSEFSGDVYFGKTNANENKIAFDNVMLHKLEIQHIAKPPIPKVPFIQFSFEVFIMKMVGYK